ncbi:MAG: DUF4251 domain-containing protein [Bacteroidetes bacterium]|nr:DUF4251 domain-containing protein [Bacteroidota bacterium]
MKKIAIIACITFLFSNYVDASDTTITSLLQNKRFAFQPNNMIPATGRLRVLDYVYALQVKNDSLIVNLPYIGKAYTAPIDPNDVGYNFTSTDFSYSVSKGKKDSYIAVIKTNDRVYNPTFTLIVFNNCRASLLVNSTEKQQISYNGMITGLEK